MQKFQRNPLRELPDGRVCRVYPFHISLEGLESKILCRDEEDYDAFVKIIAVCCLRKNVILVIYAVVSNHGHCVVLAASQEDADDCAREIKRMYSMYFGKKYSVKSVMKDMDAKALFIDSDWYLRNALAYDVRNAMFCNGKVLAKTKTLVCALSRRERRRLLRTDDNLSSVKWILDENEQLVPSTICDWRYLESAFLGDQSFFLKTIGTLNTAEMTQKLVDSPRTKYNDTEFLRSINEISQRWFQKDVKDLPIDKKARLIRYVSHSFRTDPSQLARAFELSRNQILRFLEKA